MWQRDWFSHLLVVGQLRNIGIEIILQFELSPVLPALVDEYGCLKNRNKAVLVKFVWVFTTSPPASNVVLVDGSQLLFHVVWPVAGTTLDLAENFCIRLAQYPHDSRKLIVFDQYDQGFPCSKDHEQTRREKSIKAIRLTPTTQLPCREAVLHNANNKSMLNNILCGYSLPGNIQFVNKMDSIVSQAEADIATLCNYILKAEEEDAQTIWILSDDTDVFGHKKTRSLQRLKWSGDVLDINETAQKIWFRKCSQLLRNMPCQAVRQCNVLPLFGKGMELFLTCTVFCKCKSSRECRNPMKIPTDLEKQDA